MTCFGCGDTRDVGTRLPRGWKRHGATYCGACWRKRYILRGISIPVASVDDWTQFRADLKQAWVQTTNCANWMMSELYVRDVKRNSQEKMPPMGRVYLYPEARKLFPELPAQSVASLEQAVQRHYRKTRYKVVWTSAAALATHRYPVPFPVHNQSWYPSFDADRPHVSVRLGGRRQTLRLRGGPRYRRQLKAFKQMTSREALWGELALYRVAAAGGAPERGRNQNRQYDVMCKMVAWLPRNAVNSAAGTLFVRTRAGSLLQALNVKDEVLWNYHGDHLRRWSAEHARRVQRLADDSKYEQRPVPAFSDRRADEVRKYHNRMSSATHEIAAALAGYASRRRFAAVEYRDEEQGFCEQFPYYELRLKIAEKLDAAGIEFRHAGAEVASEAA